MNDAIERMITEVIDAEQLPEPPSISAPLAGVSTTAVQPMFEDNEMLGLCAEALTNMRGDRKQMDNLISNFVEMVFNEGDSTTASKEALVALMVAKTNMNDKMMSLVELMAKFKLKEMASGPKSVTANQENHYHFGTRRSFLEQIDRRMQQKKKKEKDE